MPANLPSPFRRVHIRIITIALLALVCVFAGVSYSNEEGEAVPKVEGIEGTPVRLLEAQVSVEARVECKRYHGKVLNCTINPTEAVMRQLDARLIVGYSGVEIAGNYFLPNGAPGAEMKFIPEVDGRRVDPSGTRTIRVNAIFVE